MLNWEIRNFDIQEVKAALEGGRTHNYFRGVQSEWRYHGSVVLVQNLC